MQTQGHQLSLGLEFGDGSHTGEHPDDIKRFLQILSGDNPLTAGDLDETGLNGQPRNAQEKWQESMLKKHEVKNSIQAMINFEVYTFDLGLEEECQKFKVVLDRVMAPGSKFQFSYTPEYIITDEKAPRGFRVVTVVKVWEMATALKPTADRPTYQVIANQEKPKDN